MEITPDEIASTSGSFKVSAEYQLPELHLQTDPSFEPPHTP